MCSNFRQSVDIELILNLSRIRRVTPRAIIYSMSKLNYASEKFTFESTLSLKIEIKIETNKKNDNKKKELIPSSVNIRSRVVCLFAGPSCTCHSTYGCEGIARTKDERGRDSKATPRSIPILMLKILLFSVLTFGGRPPRLRARH